MIGERLKHQFMGNEAWILSYREESMKRRNRWQRNTVSKPTANSKNVSTRTRKTKRGTSVPSPSILWKRKTTTEISIVAATAETMTSTTEKDTDLSTVLAIPTVYANSLTITSGSYAEELYDKIAEKAAANNCDVNTVYN
jgi:hypothetical protein